MNSNCPEDSNDSHRSNDPSGVETPSRSTGDKFIPYRRADVIKMCLRDGHLSENEKPRFQSFCAILTAYYHFKFQAVLERLKDYFAVVDPETDFKTFESISTEQIGKKAEGFYHDFKKLLVDANFQSLSRDELKRSFQDQSLIRLHADVDLDDFERYLCYYRGTRTAVTTHKHFPFPDQEITYELYERVILLLKFKGQEYFETNEKKKETLHFKPGRTYIFYFRDVPKTDLEILFPNVKITMTRKDKWLFLFPTIGLGLSTLLKISANVILFIGFVLFMMGLTSYAEKMGFDQEALRTRLVSTIAAIATMIVVLGGFSIRQYLNYKSKLIKFLNDVTQVLFFRNVSMNSGVFQNLVDAAEEEECKEAILAYYHLLTSEKPLTKSELDGSIEAWFEKRFDTIFNFDIEDALKKLEKLKCKMPSEDPNANSTEEAGIVFEDAKGRWKAQPLDRAVCLLDTIWDQIYQFHE